jgi:glycosyltransferase involved in cell wall biosynthesis
MLSAHIWIKRTSSSDGPGDRRVRILYIEPLGVRGGMGHYNEALVTAYEQAGASLQVVTSSHDASYGFQANVHLSRLFRLALDRSKPRVLRAMGYVGGYLGCLRLARRSDVAVLHFLHRPAADRLALKAFRRLGCRLVLVAHDPQPVLPSQRGSAYQRCLRLFDLVVVHGPKARADVIAQGAPDDKVVVAPFGDYRAASPLGPAAACRTLGLPDPARPTVAIVGNLKPGKGIRRAREALETGDSPVRTLLIAGTKQGDWDIEDALRIPEDSRLQIVRVDRRMSDLEELAAYSLADVLLALYDSSYSSGVIARAHSMGKPVVLTNVGDLALQAHTDDVVVAADYTAAELRGAIARCLAERVEAPAVWDCEAWRHHAGSVLARLS